MALGVKVYIFTPSPRTKVSQWVKHPEPIRIVDMPLMRQTAEPGSKACVGEEGESVGVTKNAGGDPIQTSEEEVVQHPVNMEDDVIVRRICPHIHHWPPPSLKISRSFIPINL